MLGGKYCFVDDATVRGILVLMALLFACGCVQNQEEFNEVVSMKVTSKAFNDGAMIPAKYTCDGSDINPPLSISDVPAKTQSIALIVDDPDAPMGDWVHWVVWNIDPKTAEIKEDSVPGTEGMNDFRMTKYGGPCPPGGTHRYYFKVYALDAKLNLPQSTNKVDLLSAMDGHILAQAQLIGKYKRA